VLSSHNNKLYGISAWLFSRSAKKNITDLEVDASKIYDLRPVSFNWKEQKDGAPRAIGVIAEEVDKVLPELVRYDKEGRPYHVTYELLSVLILKELQKMRQAQTMTGDSHAVPPTGLIAGDIDDLRAENAALKQKLADLQARAGALEKTVARQSDLERRPAAMEARVQREAAQWPALP
jgi:hypothetical protein